MSNPGKDLGKGDSEEVVMKKKLSQIQTRLQNLETNQTSGSKKNDKTDKEKSGIEACLEVKGKIDYFRERNKELEQENESLALDILRLQEKIDQLQEYKEANTIVERDLREHQTDQDELRKKWFQAEDRNAKMLEELKLLRDDLEQINAKAQDDEILLQALQGQQETFDQMADRQRQLRVSEHRRYCDLLREFKARHTTNTELLARLTEADRDAEQRVEDLRDPAPITFYATMIDPEEEEETKKIESVETLSSLNAEEGEENLPKEEGSLEKPPPPVEDPEVVEAREERDVLRQMFESEMEEVNRLSEIALNNNQKLMDWKNQLLNARSQYFQINAEVREMQEKKARSGAPPIKDSQETRNELMIRQEVENEEQKFLSNYWSAISNHWENLYRIYQIGNDRSKKLFVDALKEMEDEMMRKAQEQKEAEERERKEREQKEQEEADKKEKGAKKGKGKK